MPEHYQAPKTGADVLCFEDGRTLVRAEVTVEPAEGLPALICLGGAFELCGQGADPAAARASFQSVIITALGYARTHNGRPWHVFGPGWIRQSLTAAEADALVRNWRADDAALVFDGAPN